ncbi:MBL fold metallo-hydrolase [Halobacteriaceae archaeon GCM10025711]
MEPSADGSASDRRTRHAVRRLEFDVDWPPGHVAAYLVEGEESVLVDAGTHEAHGADELRSGLAAHGYEPADVAHVVVTHPHVDHIGQVPALLDAADPTLYAPAGVRERFTRDVDEHAATVRRNGREAGLDGDHLDEAVEWVVANERRDRDLLSVDDVDVWVEDGERLTVGDLTLEPVHAPGHQADHLCYGATLGGDRVLFAGDMAIRPFRPVALHDGFGDGVRDAIPAFYDALDRLDEEAVDRVFPGHGPVHDEYADAIDHSRRSLDRLLDDAHARLGDGVSTAVELAFHRSDDPTRARYMLPEAASALYHLEATGRATSYLDDGVRQYDPQ